MWPSQISSSRPAPLTSNRQQNSGGLVRVSSSRPESAGRRRLPQITAIKVKSAANFGGADGRDDEDNSNNTISNNNGSNNKEKEKRKKKKRKYSPAHGRSPPATPAPHGPSDVAALGSGPSRNGPTGPSRTGEPGRTGPSHAKPNRAGPYQAGPGRGGRSPGGGGTGRGRRRGGRST